MYHNVVFILKHNYEILQSFERAKTFKKDEDACN